MVKENYKLLWFRSSIRKLISSTNLKKCESNINLFMQELKNSQNFAELFIETQ